MVPASRGGGKIKCGPSAFEGNRFMKNKPFENWERVEVEELVAIPTLDGEGIAERVPVKVRAWRNPKDNEIYLDGEALAELDRVKARHTGIMPPVKEGEPDDVSTK